MEEENLFCGYADAAFANAYDHKSMTSYIFLAAGGAIMWKLKKQTIIALSSMEAEYMALSDAAHPVGSEIYTEN